MEEQGNSPKSRIADKNAKVLFAGGVVLLLGSTVSLPSILEKTYLVIFIYILSLISLLYFCRLFFSQNRSKLVEKLSVDEKVWEKTVNTMKDIVTVQDKNMRIGHSGSAGWGLSCN